MAVFTAIVFQSKTTAALATADPNKRLASSVNTSPQLLFGLPSILLIVHPPAVPGFGWAASSWRRTRVSIASRVLGHYALCRGHPLQRLELSRCFDCDVESFNFSRVRHDLPVKWTPAIDQVRRRFRA